MLIIDLCEKNVTTDPESLKIKKMSKKNNSQITLYVQHFTSIFCFSVLLSLSQN